MKHRNIAMIALAILWGFLASVNAQERIVTYSPKPWLPTIWTSEPPPNCPFEQSTEIVGLAFTRRYVSYTDADTFYPSWAPDDNMYCGWTDGEIGLEAVQSGGKERARAGIVKIEGDDPMNLTVTWMAFFVNSVSETTSNVGLAEFAVFNN